MRTTAPYNTIHSLFVIGHRSRPILHTQRAARHHNRLGYVAHQRLTNNSRLLLFGLGTHSCVESGLFLSLGEGLAWMPGCACPVENETAAGGRPSRSQEAVFHISVAL